MDTKPIDRISESRQETQTEKRFEFGKNWSKFLQSVDETNISMAVESLQERLGLESLEGKSFLDAGSGSGLFSLAAVQLNASVVVSFDYDLDSVECTREIKRRYMSKASNWHIHRNDCVKPDYRLLEPPFDVVYCWGVLHHTGKMWSAFENVASWVADDGYLFVSIYNDQQWQTRIWRRVKEIYCGGPIGRAMVTGFGIPILAMIGLISDILNKRNPLRRYSTHHSRGMTLVRNWFDWLGGFPFETARPEEVFDFCKVRGFSLERLKTVGGGWGCNEFIFRRRLETHLHAKQTVK